MTQRELAGLIEQFGGECVSAPGRHTQYLVVGAAAPPLGSDGHPTAPLQRARHLRSCGYPIQIVTEDAFLAQLNLVELDTGVHQLYTVAQLSRILGVSRDRIRFWVRSGLIEPVETIHRLDYFNYQQVTSAKMLCDLVSAGLPVSRIREGLKRVRRWLPGMDVPLSQLSVLEESGRLLVRLEDGRLAEPSGQLQLEFPESSLGASLSLSATVRSADDWFREAVAAEDAGDFAGAAAAYERAIDQEPDDPILHFNLGNVLYATDHLPTAAEHFRRAVDLDGEYVEAWNNLATVLADLGQTEASITALGRALAVFPLYADAHFNLGDVLASAGRMEDARRHWRQYLQLDPKSPWAEDVKRRLASLQAVAPTPH